MKRVFACVLGTVLLVALLATPAFAGPPPDNPGNGPPAYEKAVFIHYGNGSAHAKPPGKPGGGGKQPTLYSYSRVHWAASDIPVEYYINPANCPIATADAQAAIVASFQTWEGDPASNIDFNFVGATNVVPDLDALAPDLVNVVAWADLTGIEEPGVIGVTVVWYTRGLKYIVDCDTVLNTAGQFTWTQAAGISNDAANTAAWPFVPTDDTDVDVQNIMTHEAGHWLMLNDLYDSVAAEQTMYGYADDCELKARSLETGDLAGVLAIYP